MRECTETDKPLVSIVMATYNPRMDWLKEQLISLNNQSYGRLELLVIDDCSTNISIEEISETIKAIITGIPYKIMRNIENMGSTRTFEKVTALVAGEYIAYCDQDDIWYPDKIETLLGLFTSKDVNLVFSDVQVIDETGSIKAHSISEFRTRHIFYEGTGLSSKLILKNFVMGCTMLIKRETAQKSMPFFNDMVHDHYLALMASLNGKIVLCRRPLISYRIHSDNQTNTLTGINSKADYYNKKIRGCQNRIEQLEQKNLSVRISEFTTIKKWAEARVSYYKGDIKAAKWIWKYRYYDYSSSLFELLMLKLPNFLFQYALKKIKEGKNK